MPINDGILLVMQNKHIKHFDKWSAKKKKIDKRDVDIEKVMFQEKEIWWCATGVNVGFEQDGKNSNFERPVLIYKKFNKHIFLGIPLTSQDVDISLPFYLKLIGAKVESVAILSQIRLFDSKRLLRHIETINEVLFGEVKESLKRVQGLEAIKSLTPLAGGESTVPKDHLYAQYTALLKICK